MNWLDTLLWLGVLQGLIVAGILVSVRSDHRVANRIMAAMVLVIALLILQRLLLRNGFFFQYPATAVLIPPLAFTLGPLLYLYAYNLTGRTLQRRHWAHFMLALLFLCAFGSLWTFSPEIQRQIITYFWSPRNDLALAEAVRAATGPFLWVWIEYHLQGNLFVLQFGLYCLLVLRRIRDHNRRLQSHYSSLERINLRWLRALTLSLLVFLLLFVLINRLYLLLDGPFDSPTPVLRTPLIYLVVFIYAIGISAIFQPSLVSGAARVGPGNDDGEPSDAGRSQKPDGGPPVDPLPAPTNAESTKYARSGLDAADAERYRLTLMRKMEDEQLYLNSELTLPDLASHAGMSPNLVSQVINGEMQQNFFSFVNGYRVQRAMEMLTDASTRDLPIVELAVEVGFKSKSSFYDAFKRVTQMTPTQFKKAEGQS